MKPTLDFFCCSDGPVVRLIYTDPKTGRLILAESLKVDGTTYQSRENAMGQQQHCGFIASSYTSYLTRQNIARLTRGLNDKKLDPFRALLTLN